MSTETKLTRDEEGESVDNTKYRGMIGSLLYLTASRPDIMFSVCLCARFQEDPKTSHLEAVKRIFRYIKGTTHLGLWYPKGSGIETIVYADSDHAGDYVDRKSTSGVCTFMGCCLTSWFSKKQTALAISTTEAEYVSAGKACQQALWMKQALIDYGVRLDDIPIMCDNKGAIDLKEDVEPKQIILDPDDQPMWESAKTVAPIPNFVIIQLDVDDNFVINSTHLNMIRESKFDGYLRADPHDHIREFLVICNMFRYGETQSEAVKLLIFPFSFLNKELQDICNKYNELSKGNASKNHLNDDTPMYEHHEENYIQSEGNKDRNSHDRHSHQSHHDRNDPEKSLTELKNDVKNDLEYFKRCIHSMRTVHWKLFARDDGKTTGVLPKKKSKPINQ
ncbi:hypothetical protein Tco_1192273 [Tanacetum coccineum]